ncbi:MAG TPA: alpha/beta hydrolase [Cyclobacteriaceae bacterium]|nr:alpha/beta hydrolase [Cyclobacteriaceae bacterium]
MKFLGTLFCVFLIALSSYAQPDTASFKSFDDTKIYYESIGTGYPVLLVHGFITNSESWKRSALYNDLSAAGYKVIIADLRGNGKSGKPHDPEAYENDAEAMDLMVLADKLGLTKYSVVGYSRGSIIASRLLILDKRINNVVLGGMGADFTNPEWPRRIMFYKALSGEAVPELEGLVKRIKDDPTLDQLALAYMQKAQPSTSRADFGKVKKPVLVICGDKDEDNGSSKELAALIPKSAYKRVPGIHNDTARSKDFSMEVIAFLKANK